MHDAPSNTPVTGVGAAVAWGGFAGAVGLTGGAGAGCRDDCGWGGAGVPVSAGAAGDVVVEAEVGIARGVVVVELAADGPFDSPACR